MKILSFLTVGLLTLIACDNSQNDNSKNSVSDYRSLETVPIEGGKKFVTRKKIYVNGNIEFKYDTSSLSEDAIYELEKDKHMLDQFYLSYSEWETKSCSFSVNESHYWDKAMIGLLEKSGKLRIEYLGQTIYLKSDKNLPIKEGNWNNTFKNDTIQINISIEFYDRNKNKEIRFIAGNGKINGKIKDKEFQEKIFGVYSP